MIDTAEEWFDHLDRLSLDEAKCEVLRVVLINLNLKRLGQPDKKFVAALLGITDIDHLTRMNEVALKAFSWQEVLETPSTWEELRRFYDGKPPERNAPVLS